VDYSIFIMVALVMVLMETEEQRGPTLAELLLSIFIRTLCVVYFSIN
jgi:hypothetical protein